MATPTLAIPFAERTDRSQKGGGQEQSLGRLPPWWLEELRAQPPGGQLRVGGGRNRHQARPYSLGFAWK